MQCYLGHLWSRRSLPLFKRILISRNSSHDSFGLILLLKSFSEVDVLIGTAIMFLAQQAGGIVVIAGCHDGFNDLLKHLEKIDKDTSKFSMLLYC